MSISTGDGIGNYKPRVLKSYGILALISQDSYFNLKRRPLWSPKV